MMASPLASPTRRPTLSNKVPSLMITQANGLTKIVVHRPSYASNGLKFLHSAKASVSTLFSLYKSI